MLHVGIDMSKADFHVSFDDSGKTKVFLNVTDGFREYERVILGHASKTDAVIGVESTGTYHLPFATHLSSRGWDVRVINPLVTSRLARSKIRNAKTDRIDAGLVRRAVAAGEGHPFLENADTLMLKALVGQRDALVSVRADMKRRVEAQSQVMKAVNGRAEAPESYVRVIEALFAEIRVLNADMLKYGRDAQALLRTIPGIGPAAAASLVAHVGNIRRFPSPTKLVAYLGLDCRVKQSGTSVHGKGFITKRGNAQLRKMLYMCALVAKGHIHELGSFYDRKKSEGHHHTSALCAVERKLVHIIWAVWTRETAFMQKTPII